MSLSITSGAGAQESDSATDASERNMERIFELIRDEDSTTGSSALRDLMAEAYPGLITYATRTQSGSEVDERCANEYRRKHALLKSRLTNGRNWFLMQQRFSVGILALVYTQSSHGPSNNE